MMDRKAALMSRSPCSAFDEYTADPHLRISTVYFEGDETELVSGCNEQIFISLSKTDGNS